jgi:RNA polymerase sigma factor (sigma-70 family)
MAGAERNGRDASPRAAVDAELVAALADPATRDAAWAALVDAYSPRLYAVARSFRLDERTAEDLVQVAWLRLMERSQQLRDAGALGAWLCTIVRNEATRLTTRRREIPSPLDLEGRPSLADPVDGRLLADERALTLRSAFGRLGDECQRLLRLLLVEPPMPYDDIAAAVGRPRGSLGPTRRRCLDALRRLLPAGFEP